VVDPQNVDALQGFNESEERYRTLFESAIDVIFCIGPDGRYQTVNEVGARTMRIAAEEIAGKHMNDLFPPPLAERHLARVNEVFRTGKPVRTNEVFTITPEGERWYSANLSPIRDETGAVRSVMGVLRDITDYKRATEAMRRLEDQLRQAQKMEAIGRLAGGIAHDFNNLLTAIIGYSQFLMRDAPKDTETYAHALQISRAAERAARLTRQLLAFSRKQVLDLAVYDLNVIIDDTKGMLERVIGEDIHLVTILAPSLHRVRVDRNQVEQIILNLAVNARDAMPDGGTLTLETSNAELDESCARNDIDFRPGSFAMIAVSDTGEGMDAETRAHIFEPFFTTKEPGTGTGLGLSTAYGIVKQHQGHIAFETQPGRGTTFRVYFPAIDEPAAEAGADTAEEAPRGKETLLIVEDNEGVRRLLADGLTAIGYGVLEAASPEEAERIFEANANVVRLVISDVVLPRLSGIALVDRLARRRPGLRVIYISGYPGSAAAELDRLARDAAFLQKPFTVERLARTVRAALDSPPRRP
jgi:two-component system, cell cycle sensor histidine kinase and response regulator CckA